ncbi:MAG: hypothetical protein J5918_04210 [Prevotella sp.]|jgi:uncharacterized protein YoxC|nr:hypothetical protein [Prevotella sp.]MBR1621903.1 hypothetical protein [Prevotella sp.]
MIETIVISLLIIAIAVALLSIKVIFLKNGSFSSQHIHDNEALKEQGIDCVMEQDRQARENNRAT